MFFLIIIICCSNTINASDVELLEDHAWQSNLTGVHWSSIALGDIDNDNDLDLIVTGCSAGGTESCTTIDNTRVYINNGTTLQENTTWEQNLTGVGWSSITLGDIDNDGDLDLFVSGSNDGTNGFDIKVYINNGTTLQENTTWEQDLTISVYAGGIALGDIDNDGDLDLAVTGANLAVKNGVYINNGTSFVKNSTWIESLPRMGNGVDDGSHVALGDVDNNGYLDLVMVGSRGTSWARGVYINNGTSLVENSTWETNFNAIFGEAQHAISFGNWNNDDYLDFAVIGLRAGDHFYIFKNTGTGFVVNTTEDSPSNACIPGVYDGSTSWGDYDNDGDLDTVVIGMEKGRARVIEQGIANPWGCTFAADNTASANISNNIVQGSLAWGDIDNDGDIDLVITGDDDGTKQAKVYINNITTANTDPNPPTSSFSSTFDNEELVLTWGNGSDTETPILGLYYNLRVGTSSGGNEIVSGVYGGGDDNGYFGNMMQRKSIRLKGLSPSTTYYWSVQTIDTGLAKSAWSTEQSYTTEPDIAMPTVTINQITSWYNTSNATITFNITVTDNSVLSNVTLYGNWTGAHLNETNSSGQNSTYIFTKNLSTYGDGLYYWNIRSCDNSNNCRNTTIRYFTIDTTKPTITLISPTNASSWTSSGTVTFTYNVSDITPLNCTLYIDDESQTSSTYNTPNTQLTFSKELSNGNYNYSINCSDSTNNTNSSLTYQLTVSYRPATTSTTSGSSGGGSGGASSTTTSETLTIGNINALSTVTKSTTKTSITQVSITPNTNSNNVQLVIDQLSTKPTTVSEPTHKVYNYIDITPVNINDTTINTAKIRFKVNRTWIDDNNINIDKVYLLRYKDNTWEKLSTKRITNGVTGQILNTITGLVTGNNYIHYEATTSGFSTFAITGEQKTTTESITEEETTENITDIIESNITDLTDYIEEKGYDFKPIVLVVLILVVVGYFVVRKSL